jgi:tetratricopeptide (TPR) repeat protein
MRLLPVLATFCVAACGGISMASAAVAESPSNSTILGTTSELMANGAIALEQGRAEEGVRLTLAGIKASVDFHDIAAGHANLCAGYAMQKLWEEALFECNVSIEMDDSNWRAFNNRAAVFVAKGQYDKAIADVVTGLKIAPESAVLKKSLEVAYEWKRVHQDRSRSATHA